MASLKKPKLSGRKPSDRKLTRKPDLEIEFIQLDKNGIESRESFTFKSRNAMVKISYELFFRSLVPTWLTDARKTVGTSYFRWTKKIILCLSHVGVSVLWLAKAKRFQSTVHCTCISGLNALKLTSATKLFFPIK